MVCEKCEKKLSKIVTPDPWTGAPKNASQTTSGGPSLKKRELAKPRFNPISQNFASCRICRQKVHQTGSHYCQSCAYKKGICAMCGKKLLDVRNYKQSSA